MFGQGASGVLGTAADWLDTPRQAVYKGVDAAYHALGGDRGRTIDHFADLLGAAGMDRDSLLTKGLGLAGDVATDPLTYAGGAGARFAQRFIPELATGLGAAGKAAGEIGKFREPLEGVTVMRGVGTDALGDLTGKVARLGRGADTAAIEAEFPQMARDLGVTTEAGYSPASRAVSVAEGASKGAQRHEMVHAVIDNAARANDTGDLPLLMRAPAAMKAGIYGQGKDFNNAYGAVAQGLDELAAHTLAGRSTADQLRGAAGYLFNPTRNAYYGDFLGQMSPAVGRAFKAIGYAPAAAGGVALGSLSQALQGAAG